MDGRTPPSLSLPHLGVVEVGEGKDEETFAHPATVPNSPISRSSLPGRQIGIMLSAKVTLLSVRTRARSFSYVKKLYFGWTTFLAAFSSKCWFGSLADIFEMSRDSGAFHDYLAEEKSHSPILTRICEIIKLKKLSSKKVTTLSLLTNMNSLINAVAGSCDPVFIDKRSSASVSRGETKEGRSSHRHLMTTIIEITKLVLMT